MSKNKDQNPLLKDVFTRVIDEIHASQQTSRIAPIARLMQLADFNHTDLSFKDTKKPSKKDKNKLSKSGILSTIANVLNQNRSDDDLQKSASHIQTFSYLVSEDLAYELSSLESTDVAIILSRMKPSDAVSILCDQSPQSSFTIDAAVGALPHISERRGEILSAFTPEKAAQIIIIIPDKKQQIEILSTLDAEKAEQIIIAIPDKKQQEAIRASYTQAKSIEKLFNELTDPVQQPSLFDSKPPKQTVKSKPKANFAAGPEEEKDLRDQSKIVKKLISLKPPDTISAYLDHIVAMNIVPDKYKGTAEQYVTETLNKIPSKHLDTPLLIKKFDIADKKEFWLSIDDQSVAGKAQEMMKATQDMSLQAKIMASCPRSEHRKTIMQNMDAKEIGAIIAVANDKDIYASYNDLGIDRRKEILNAADDKTKAEILSHEHNQQRFFNDMDTDSVAKVISHIKPELAVKILDHFRDEKLVAVRSSPNFSHTSLKTRDVKIQQGLLLHDFQIKLDGVDIKQRADGKFVLDGVTVLTSFDEELAKKHGMSKDSKGNLVLDKNPTVLENKLDFSSLDENFSYIMRNTDIGKHKITHSVTSNKFAESDFVNITNDQVSKFQKTNEGKPLAEWCLRNPCFYNYTRTGKYINNGTVSVWRSHNTQGMFFSRQLDESKTYFQEIHNQRSTKNRYPEFHYSGPMNMYFNLMADIKAEQVADSKKGLDPKSMNMLLESFCEDPQRKFHSSPAGITELGQKVKEYELFFSLKYDQNSTVLDSVKKSFTDASLEIKSDSAKKMLGDYCLTLKQVVAKDLPVSNLRPKILAVSLKEKLTSVQDIAVILAKIPDDQKVQTFSKLSSELTSIDPKNANKTLASVLEHVEPKQAAEMISSLETKQVTEVITNLAPKKAEQIITAIADPKQRKAISAAVKEAQDAKVVNALNSMSDPKSATRIADLCGIKYDRAQKSSNDALERSLESSWVGIDKQAIISVGNSLRSLKTQEISLIVDRMKPEVASAVILHLGDQEKSKEVLNSLSDKQFAKVVASKNFVNPGEDISQSLEKRGIKVEAGKEKQAYSKLINGENKNIVQKAKTFVQKYVTKPQEYKSFADRIKAQKGKGPGPAI